MKLSKKKLAALFNLLIDKKLKELSFTIQKEIPKDQWLQIIQEIFQSKAKELFRQFVVPEFTKYMQEEGKTMVRKAMPPHNGVQFGHIAEPDLDKIIHAKVDKLMEEKSKVIIDPKKEQEKQIASMIWSDYDFTPRARTGLLNYIKGNYRKHFNRTLPLTNLTITEVYEYFEPDKFLKIRHIGKGSLNEVLAVFKQAGLIEENI